jgi:hypothetical protein
MLTEPRLLELIGQARRQQEARTPKLAFRQPQALGNAMPRPNLFDFATSELSQDAFLCWLLSWADHRQKANDVALHQTAVVLLSRLLDLHGIEAPSECTVEVERQYKDIGILVLVNDDIALPIEDKVDISEHSNQLTRHLDIVRQDFSTRKVAPVYFKTGDQSNHDAVKAAGWKCFLRPELLEVLEHGRQVGVRNDIFRDFLCRTEGEQFAATARPAMTGPAQS